MLQSLNAKPTLLCFVRLLLHKLWVADRFQDNSQQLTQREAVRKISEIENGFAKRWQLRDTTRLEKKEETFSFLFVPSGLVWAFYLFAVPVSGFPAILHPWQEFLPITSTKSRMPLFQGL